MERLQRYQRALADIDELLAGCRGDEQLALRGAHDELHDGYIILKENLEGASELGHLLDAATYGAGFKQDGKRVDPARMLRVSGDDSSQPDGY